MRHELLFIALLGSWTCARLQPQGKSSFRVLIGQSPAKLDFHVGPDKSMSARMGTLVLTRQ